MNLEQHWPEIQKVLRRGQASTIYCSIATINPDGTPNVTPIGTVFLRGDCTGYYFDQYATALARNLDMNPNVCVMAVNASRAYWVRSLFLGRFLTPPGVRLYGLAQPRRKATQAEISAVEARVRPTKWLKGSRMLWSDFTYVRDIRFTSFRPVSYPAMMDGLWGSCEA
ncbi:MAG: pyridoxamine 5'-phosphate oxidase family protein [Rhodanobacteraceae bacterium]|nr:pyridoxamine 5'-phosphate oxidase family protein [Rhodanobacteraceae bacterium]